MLPLLEEAYIDTGKVYFVYKEYPVVGGDLAVVGSLAGKCAGTQGQFWAMNDWLFSNISLWRTPDMMTVIESAASDLGMDVDAFTACLDAQEAEFEDIVADYREGQEYGIRGTPNFVINGHLLQGLLPADQLSDLIDILIEQAETGQLPANVATVTPSPTPDTDFAEEVNSVKGAADAPITIVEFSDYQCPFCQRHVLETMPRIQEQFIDTNQVKYVFKDFPLTSIHPQAVAAANAARCAGEQDSYWPMHDTLFETQNEWAGQSNVDEIFTTYATELELDVEAFSECLSSERYTDAIFVNLQEGIDAGVTGTPAFFINGVFVSGAQPFEVFEQIINQQLGLAE